MKRIRYVEDSEFCLDFVWHSIVFWAIVDLKREMGRKRRLICRCFKMLDIYL